MSYEQIFWNKNTNSRDPKLDSQMGTIQQHGLGNTMNDCQEFFGTPEPRSGPNEINVNIQQDPRQYYYQQSSTNNGHQSLKQIDQLHQLHQLQNNNQPIMSNSFGVTNREVTDNRSLSKDFSTGIHSPNTEKSSDYDINQYSRDQNSRDINITPDDTKLTKAKYRKQLLDEQDALLIARDDSELTEEELKIKKKAQNRAAQRAFRERKEIRLKDLEAKLNQSEVEKQQLLEQIKILKDRQQSPNTSTINGGTRTVDGNGSDKFNFPYTQKEFINELTQGHSPNELTMNKVYKSPEDPSQKLLGVGAVWDYLQLKSEEYEIDDYTFDFEGIMKKLKGHERCHGFGPAYPLSIVDKAIKDSINNL